MGRKLIKPVSAAQLALDLGLEFVNSDADIVEVASADAASAGSLAFAKNETWAQRADGECILITDAASAAGRAGPTLVSPEPRLAFAKILAYLEQQAGFVWSAAEPVVHPTARVGRNVVLGKGVVIGEGSVIYHNAVVGDEVQIGKRCIVKSCAVIGEEGFGFERDSDGSAVRLPHIGNVVIGNDVEVGSLTTICRGTLGNTILHDGAKIDDHVHIAHNVEVGTHAFVIACAEISGGVRIGARAWIAPNASVMNQLTIGDDAVIGLGGVVLKSVADNTVVVGNPAKPLQKKS